MFRYILTILTACVLVFLNLVLLAGCGQGSGSGESLYKSQSTDLHDLRLTVNLVGNSPQEFLFQQTQTGFIERVQATLFRDGASFQSSEVLVAPESHLAELVFTGVASGEYRLLVQGFDAEGGILSEAETNLVVSPGQVTSLTLFLESGSVITPGPVARNDAYTNTPGTTLVVDAATGVLSNDTSDGGSASLVSGPTQGSLELEPDGSFRYSSNPGATGSDSFVYQLSDPTGTDQATVTITFSAVTNENLAYIYVSNPTPNSGGGSVSSIAVALDGTLSQVVIEPNGGRPLGIGKSPDDRFLYAVNVISESLVSYAVDPQTGLISRIGEELTGVEGSPHKISVHPSQRFAYVKHARGDLTSFLVGTNGALAANPNSPRVLSVTNLIRSVDPTFNASGNRMYTVNPQEDSINILAIDLDTGELTYLDPDNPTFPTDPGDSPSFSLLSRDGNHLYIANRDSNSLSTFSIAANGTLTLVSKTTVPDLAPQVMGLHPILPALYVAGDGGVVGMTTEDDGSLTTFGQPVPVASNARALLIDPTGQFAYVVIRSIPNQIDAYTISPDGELAFLQTFGGLGLSFPSGAVIVPAQ